VEQTPDSVAVVHLNQQITYRELNESANRLAHHLISLGVGAEDRVAVLLERSPAMVVSLLAILKAGAAYVPLDPVYPRRRLSFMLEDSGAKVLITEQSARESLPASLHVPVLSLSDAAGLLSGYDTTNPQSGVMPDNLAYLIYTSGSTGAPKGVLGIHRACVNRFEWMWERYPFERDEVCCQKTSLSFVDSVWEIFGPLSKGITLVLIPDEVVKDPARLIEELAARAVTRIVLVPSLLRAMLSEVTGARLPRLRYWVSSGEALSAELAARFRERMGERRLINLYGSSEVCADVTCYEVPEHPESRSVPIGRPIANTSVYILDREMRPVPEGVSGELYVAGEGLARGYLNRAGQTAERFVPHPFGDEPGMRLYRTGDVARYVAGGEIEYLGRIDQQVKVRGFRIELGEIESALASHPSVREAVGAVYADGSGDKQLVAYLVAAADGLSVGELRSYLGARLPEYMVPSLFVTLEEMPLTPNGKIDRRALPAPDEARPDYAGEYAAPATPVEEVLADIWCKLLGLERVGTRDNFFDLGGHSLMATRLLSKVREVFGVEVALREVFAGPTVAALASIIEELLVNEIEGLSEAEVEQLL
jgi:amino acid adenylation domain-containing protein